MSTEQFANNAQTSLNGAITAAATTLTVASASGFPSSAQFRILIDSEIMIVTAGAGSTTWTLTRGAEGTTAAAHAGQATVTQVLTAGGLENLDASYIGTGTLPIARGGTNSSSVLNNNRIMESSGGAIVEGPALSNGQLLIGNTGNAPSAAGLTAGTGIAITNGAGSISVGGSVFGASGPSHSSGDVPDPGSTAGSTRFLREDASWATPAGTVTSPDGGLVQVINGTETGVPAPLDVCEGRLTLTSGTPVTTSDVTGATTLYFTPAGRGSRIAMYDGTRWKYFSFSEISVKLTDSSQTGNTSNGSAVITNLTNTSQLVRGMLVTGTGIPANTTIASINSATQITLSANATATATGVALIFTLPSGTNYDVWAVISGTTAKLQFGNAWTNNTTRADAISQQDGVWSNTSAINSTDSNAISAHQGRYLGTIRITSTAGQTEDSAARRFVWNYYNSVPYTDMQFDTTSSWSNAGNGTWSAIDGGNANWKKEFVVGINETPVGAEVFLSFPTPYQTAIGLDTTTTPDRTKTTFGQSANNSANVIALPCEFNAFPGIGYHYLQGLQTTNSPTSGTAYGNNSGSLGAGNVGINSSFITSGRR